MGRRKKGRAVSGWLVLDKPYELGSTQAVGKVRWLFDAKKAGHAGTLDPLATGVLPIALGEATKTVPYVTDGGKAYRFTAKWGTRTSTDDAEGEVTASSDSRPTEKDILAALPRFTGTIEQVPPAFSAIKIDGKRAYAEARAGRDVVLDAREVEIDAFTLIETTADTAVFEVECGKGTYIRALARDMGEFLGCEGHVTALRRTWVEPFDETDAVTLEALEACAGDQSALDALLRTPLQAMDGFEELRVDAAQAARLRLGNSVIVRGRDAPIEAEDVCAVHKSTLVAIGDIKHGEFHPRRVLAAL
ncbi:MAG: tRNA pseudouridine(55) synthase TruB [Pseudomonadota bacterium]